MINKFNIWLFGFYFTWLYDLQAYLKLPKLYDFIKILTALIVSIFPYSFTHFTWFRIMVYFAEDYHYLPIDLDKLINQSSLLKGNEWHIHDAYEVHQLDQYLIK